MITFKKSLCLALFLLLSACNNTDSNTTQQDIGSNKAQAASAGAGNVIATGDNPANPAAKPQPEPESEPLGDWVEATSFASDLRDRDRDGFAGLLPILSSAPKTCSPHESLIKTAPDCNRASAPDYNNTGDTTWIDAQVFVPRHRQGQKLPVIVHSHGWGGSKLTKLRAIPACDAADEPYNCPLGELNSLIGNMFSGIEALLTDLVNHGYIVVSFSQRGFGHSEGEVMVMNPYHETQDAIAVLDWLAALGKAGDLPIAVDENNDFKVGLIGGSYGGGFQLPLAALDQRVDTIVPFGTWHSLVQSLVPNDAVKGGWGNLLCLAATGRPLHPYLRASCANMPLTWVRDRKALDPSGKALAFLGQNGLDYLQQLQQQGKPFIEGQAPFKLRKIDALLVQGMRDVLFPMNEATANFDYLQSAGGDVRLLSRKDGHINPLANQVAGQDSCGSIHISTAVRQWLDVKLRGADASILNSIPQQCVAVSDQFALHQTALAKADKIKGQFKAELGNLRGAQKCVPFYQATEDKTLAGRVQFSHLKVTNDMALGRAVAYIGLCHKSGDTVKLIDEQLSGFVPGEYHNVELGVLATQLRQGDELGVMAYKDHIQMFTFGPTVMSEFSTLLFQGFKPQEGKLQKSRQDANSAAQSLFSANAYRIEGEVIVPLVGYAN